MLSLFSQNEKLRNTLVELVQQNNGKRWPQIAKILESTFKIEIEMPYTLKAIYEEIASTSLQLKKKEMDILLNIALKFGSVIKFALPEFKKQTNIEISRNKFVSYLYRFYREAVIKGVNAFIKNKYESRKRLQRFPGQSIGRILQCREINSDDPFTIRLKKMADHLEALLMCASEIENYNQSEFYEKITNKMKKKDFFLLLNCISFMDDLRLIQIKEYVEDNQLMPDYWLQPTIKENKELIVYQSLFLDDKQKKYEMFNDAFDVQNELESKYYFNNQISNSQKKEGFSTKKARLKTVRGKITINDKKYQSSKTVRFDKQLIEEENEKQQDPFNEIEHLQLINDYFL